MPPQTFAFPEGRAVALDLAPRLESWDSRDSPGQVNLRAWLEHVGERVRDAERGHTGDLAIRVDIRLPDGVDPLWQRDLDNYLYPIARELPEQYVSIWATKGRGRQSSLRVEQAVPVAAGLREWSSFAVPRLPRDEKRWKAAVAAAAAGSQELAAGPAALQIAFTVGAPTRWAELWKPSIDGLEAVLGRSYTDPSWNPQDGRIVRLGLHRTVSRELGREADATFWTRSAPLHWDENAWLSELPDDERAEYLRQHNARVALSQRSAPAGRRATTRDSGAASSQPATGSGRPRRTPRALSDEPGVVVFIDDDAAYERWLGATPAGFVVNLLRSTAGPAVLHRATCRTISGRPARGVGWTSADYLKACSSDRSALARWLASNGAREARACGSCAP